MSKFIDYVSFPESTNLHPELPRVFPPSGIHMIVYGPCGVGKYTYVLQIMKHYSSLRNEKKMTIDTVSIRFSDIHYEVDMELLGCNSKTLWNDVYQQIIDIVQSKQEKRGFIVCKNFHKVNKELLDVFYSYMQTECIRFILITEAVSFLPESILSKCKIIPVSVPKIPAPQLNKGTLCHELPLIHKIIHSIKTLQFTSNGMREDIYNILIFDVGIETLTSHILSIPMEISQRLRAIQETVQFYKFYSNNYRPIFHLERYIYAIIIILHKLN